VGSDSARRGTPRVDEANQCIWWGDERVDLTPKAALVLRCLVQRPNQIVSKNDLLDFAWPNTHVTDGVLKVAINQLREALGDDSQQPRFIETVHRIGYRWIGKGQAPVAATASPLIPAPGLSPNSAPAFFVGRGSALAQLEQALTRADAGGRQMVFVTGDPGIGKSTVVDAFVARLASADVSSAGAARSFLFAYGQCVDGYGTSDAYMPLLQPLAQLCRQSTDIVAQLRRLAPTWLLQLPQLLEAGERDELRSALAGSTSDRMLHDLLCFIEEVTIRRTLVLLVEDLHWSDHATVGALAALAARREPARLMHPITRLRHELASKRQCLEIVLEGLDREAIDDWLSMRFPNHRLPAGLPALLQEQTSGNPLFMQNAVEDFVQRGWLKERDGAWECTVNLAALADAVPESTREMIAFRLQQLSGSDLELLEAASTIGPVFPTQALAVILEREAAAIEVDCARLARAAQVLVELDTVTWRDGRVGVQYASRHALYRQVLYARVTPARRQLLHQRFAECLEKGFAEDANVLASQLAHHFERGGDRIRAVGYRRKAARHALNRFAYPQAIEHLKSGINIIRSLPPGAERNAQELALQGDLVTPMYAVGGSMGSGLVEVIERIRELSEHSGPITPELFRALAALVASHWAHGEMPAARSVAEQLVERASGEIAETIAGGLLGFCELLQGEIEVGTRRLDRSSGLPEIPAPTDPGIAATVDAALGHCLLGHLSLSREMLEAATRRAAASKLVTTIGHVAVCGIRNGWVLLDDRVVEEITAMFASLPKQYGERWQAWSEVGGAWLDIRRGGPEGIERLERARKRLFAIGQRGYQPVFAAMIATGLLRAARYDECGALLDEGLAEIGVTGERWCEAELHRLCGELRLARAGQQRPSTERWQQLVGEAEACFRRALEIARAQGAKWWELRAAVSLARVPGEYGRSSEAHRLLSDAYGGFNEGFDLPDLRDARDLLKSLGALRS
jgi:DNA-binding winged helix-turn-helix (wHTH) protein